MIFTKLGIVFILSKFFQKKNIRDKDKIKSPTNTGLFKIIK